MAVYGFDEAKNKVEIFPVGYIYMSVSPENPGGCLEEHGLHGEADVYRLE